MPTIYDVARLAGVSPGTVSNVLNHSGKVAKDTEERILQVIEEVHYVPNRTAQRLKTSKSKNIFVIVENIKAFPAPDIVDGISEFCFEKGYDLTLFNLRVNPQTQNFQYNEYLEKQEVQNELGIALQQAKSINAGGIPVILRI